MILDRMAEHPRSTSLIFSTPAFPPTPDGFESRAFLMSASKPQLLPVEARTSQGIWLFLASLGIFFLASILLYVVYVYMRVHGDAAFTQPLLLPWSFLPSTLLLVGVSSCLEVAYRAARRDRFVLVRRSMLGACAMGIGFLAIQSDGMKRLLDGLAAASSRSESAYGYTFILVFLHAAHVVGGMVGLWITARNAMRNAYDHERSIGLRFCTLYWHFLDLVWVALIASFWIALWLVNGKASSP
jgi:cytochrome c oxidase subunit 3